MSVSVQHIPIAIWADPVTRMLSESLFDKNSAFPLIPHSTDGQEGMAALLQREVDVALLPANLVLSSMDQFDVLPAVAISSTSSPHAVLSGVDFEGTEPFQVEIRPGQEFQGLLAEIVLKELYGRVTTRLPASQDSVARMVRIESSPSSGKQVVQLDLGREWYELISYPLVWALFVTRRDEAGPAVIQAIRDAVHDIELHKMTWVKSAHLSEEEKSFYAESIRYRLDDFSIASLTEFAEFLYYYGEVTELPQLVLASYNDSDSDASSEED